jgi:ATP-dependent Lhr-like helicase
LATQDGFAGVRSLVDSRGRHRGRHRQPRTVTRGLGRWTLLSRSAPPDDRISDEILESWARQLLRRYGVVFRELITREDAAPPWSRLVSAFRRLESRGEIRGGRFVSGVGGEQYALPDAVEPLRRLREAPAEPTPIVVSATDPANLVGIVTAGSLVPAQAGSCVAYLNGRFAGWRQGAGVELSGDLDTETARHVEHALLKGPTATSPDQQTRGASWRDELNARRKIVRLREERQDRPRRPPWRGVG